MSDHGIVTEAGAVRFQRLLPAPAERVWDYLTRSELRRKWFAGGEMELRPGGGVTLIPQFRARSSWRGSAGEIPPI